MQIKYIEQETQEIAISLPASKSISNRALIIQALCKDKIVLENVSKANDTLIMQAALKNKSLKKHVGISGTVARFLTAFLSIQNSSFLITGEERIQERPMKTLLVALEDLGVVFEYLNNPYHIPFRVDGSKISGGKVSLSGKKSSQFISALMMIAPKLRQGLSIQITDELSSKPYVDMTAKLIEFFGVNVEMNGGLIKIKEQEYSNNTLVIENDWSAASYFYSALALLDEGSLLLKNLSFDSLQGDSVLAEIYYRLGIISSRNGEDILLEKSENIIDFLAYDFSACPDLAQTVICTCVGLGIEGEFSGLHTLKLKETDRILALQNELVKFNWILKEEDKEYYTLRRNNKDYKRPDKIEIKTYNDHRMAMSFAPLAILFDGIVFDDSEVVNKSFPKFWDEMKKIGIQ